MPHPIQVHFELAGDPGYQVRELVFTEALSHPYTLDLLLERELDMPLTPDEVDEQLGQDCTLTLEAEGGVRLIHGKLLQLTKVANSNEQLYVRARIVPALRLAEHTRHSRVFAEQSIKDAVDSLLSSHLGTHTRKHSWRLTHELLSHEMIVQYAESDLDFIHRQLEAAGVAYHFSPVPGEESKAEFLTLDDNGGSFQPVPVWAALPLDDEGIPLLHFIEHDATTEGLIELESASQLTVTAVDRHVFDWETEDLDPLEGKAEPEATLSTRQDDAVRNEIPAAGIKPVQTEAELELRRQHQERGTARGKSTVPGFAPGRLFAVQDYGTFLITKVVHRGESSTDSLSAQIDYLNQFECIRIDPAQSPDPRRFVPRRRTPRPNMGGPHTALVVDAGGKDAAETPIIHTDKKGRIKVRFHWEREADDDGVFAWLRVAQTWAGLGYGFVFVPRVGMEVVVDFLGGDPDAPLVVGCVYDDRQVISPDSDQIAESETRSWIRTRSEDGEGFNELLFDDARGAELVHLRAQKDRVADILNNETISVGANQSVSVGNDQSITVGHDQTLSVTNDQKVTIGPNRSTQVKTADTLSVGSTRTVTVGDTKTITVGEASITMDKTAGITITFQGNSIALSPSGITVNGKTISQTSKGAFTLDGVAVTQTATGVFTVKGGPITLNPPG